MSAIAVRLVLQRFLSFWPQNSIRSAFGFKKLKKNDHDEEELRTN
jgi:hypothetical protein